MHLAKFMRGSVNVESNLDVGTKVKVYLTIDLWANDEEESVLSRISKKHSQELMSN